MRIYLILILTLYSFYGVSQEGARKSVTPNRNNYNVGLTAGIGGPLSILSVSLDVFIKDFNVEAGAGCNGIIFGGTTIYGNLTHHHSFSTYNPNWSFFYGLGYASYEQTLQITSNGKIEEGHMIYLASGIDFIGRKGGTIKLEVGPSYVFSEQRNIDNDFIKRNDRFSAYVGLKFGFHFGGEGHSPRRKIKYQSGDYYD